jgi:hypothetical protein
MIPRQQAISARWRKKLYNCTCYKCDKIITEGWELNYAGDPLPVYRCSGCGFGSEDHDGMV